PASGPSATRRRCAPRRSDSRPRPERAGSSAVSDSRGRPGMDIRKIKKLIELLEESGIAEIEIKEGEEAVRISRMPTAGAGATPQLTHLVGLAPPPAAVSAGDTLSATPLALPAAGRAGAKPKPSAPAMPHPARATSATL